MKKEELPENNLTFAGIIKEKLNQLNINIVSGEQEPLAFVDYFKELDIKNSSLREYWKIKELPAIPLQIKPSVKSRYYRTTSKRRVINRGNKFYFLYSESDSLPQNGLLKNSLLEPEEHRAIYEYLSERINNPAYKVIGQSLNYIIIRGSYSEFTVIFNVNILNAQVVHKLKLLGELLKKTKINIVSAFIYLDPTRSEYYLENERPADVINFKKLFGPDKIFLKAGGKKYSYHPTSFSQVNESMIPVILEEAKRLIVPDEAACLFDLYCGYGLFSLYLADYFDEIIGIESEGESVNSAIVNSTFSKDKRKLRFIPKRISGNSINEILQTRKDLSEYFILDPPRQGTDQGVIKAIALRQPKQVLHIFCGIERIQDELLEWKKYKYNAVKVVPLDMFPGTSNLEILFLLEYNKQVIHSSKTKH